MLQLTVMVVPLAAAHTAPPFEAGVVTINVCVIDPPAPQLLEHVDAVT